MGGQPSETRDRQGNQFFLGSGPEIADGRMDAPAPPRDIHVVESRRPHLLFFRPGTAKNRMGMRVDESGREDATAAVDGRVLRITTLELIAGTDGLDASVTDGNGRVGKGTQLTHFGTAPRTR